MKKRHLVYLILLIWLAGCAPQSTPSPPTTAPPVSVAVDDPNTGYNESIVPDKGQPAFPKIGQYWVIDNGNCFTADAIVKADEILEQLRVDRIAEVVVICQPYIKGSSQDGLWWATNYLNWSRLGSKEEKRSFVWLIRPDVDPANGRVTGVNSDWFYQNTALDYGDIVQDAGDYANANYFDEALIIIVEDSDKVFRQVVENSTP